ncbi:MAG: HPr(Ser) kinase/phosphatase [Acidobacteriota bacterium]
MKNTKKKMIKVRKGLEVKSLLEVADLNIKKTYNEKWLTKKITHPYTQKPGLALAGYLNYLNKGSLQVFGKSELGYLHHLEPDECKKRLNNFLSFGIPGIVISENLIPKTNIIEIANRNRIPVLISDLKSSLIISRTSNFLYRYFSKKVRINGVLMDIMGMGVLITGESGIGKSETALELIKKGHQLISDDLIEFYLDSNEEPVGKYIDKIKKWIEVRGLGIINVVDMFGFGALLEEKKLDLVIELEKWDSKKKYDRLGEHNLYFPILGKDIQMFKLPVAVGRNLSTLIEIAVKFYISLKSGSESFMEYLSNQEEK